MGENKLWEPLLIIENAVKQGATRPVRSNFLINRGSLMYIQDLFISHLFNKKRKNSLRLRLGQSLGMNSKFIPISGEK
jgi:hypothetical protein